MDATGGADNKMEGWLYCILVNRIGLQISRKRYFILQDNCLKCYKTAPLSDKEVSFLYKFSMCSMFHALICGVCFQFRP